MDGFELRDLDQKRGHSGRAASYELDIAHRREERRALTLRVAPALARLKAERGKELAEPREGLRRGDGCDGGNSLDHLVIVVGFV